MPVMHSKLSQIVSSVVFTFGIAAAAPVSAHHAFSAEFDINKPIELTGTLTKVEWVNPHSWIYIDVKNADGGVTSWAIEFGAVATLRRSGLQRSDFPLGTEVVVKAYQAKSGRAIANAQTVTLPDGRNMYAGDEPDSDGPPR